MEWGGSSVDFKIQLAAVDIKKHHYFKTTLLIQLAAVDIKKNHYFTPHMSGKFLAKTWPFWGPVSESKRDPKSVVGDLVTSKSSGIKFGREWNHPGL